MIPARLRASGVVNAAGSAESERRSGNYVRSTGIPLWQSECEFNFWRRVMTTGQSKRTAIGTHSPLYYSRQPASPRCLRPPARSEP